MVAVTLLTSGFASHNTALATFFVVILPFSHGAPSVFVILECRYSSRFCQMSCSSSFSATSRRPQPRSATPLHLRRHSCLASVTARTRCPPCSTSPPARHHSAVPCSAAHASVQVIATCSQVRSGPSSRLRGYPFFTESQSAQVRERDSTGRCTFVPYMYSRALR